MKKYNYTKMKEGKSRKAIYNRAGKKADIKVRILEMEPR